VCVSIAKLIAMCFIDNPNKYKNVKFIDGDENNYNASNLEWVKPKSDEDKKSRKKNTIRNIWKSLKKISQKKT
jgi:hypothetical protein